jgi:tetratricopeptide (TPR) repeat protein
MKTDSNQNRPYRMFAANLARARALVMLWIIATYASCVSAQVLSQQDLQKQIQIYSAATLHADPPSMAPLPAGRIWLRLATLYEDAGMYTPSEMAFHHALRLLAVPPVSQADLAQAMDGIGTVYMARGELEQAELAEQQALHIREAHGLDSQLAMSWYHLATVYLHKRRADMAREYAQLAVDKLQADHNSSPDEQMVALFVLARSLCESHQYPQAIATMETAMRVVRSIYGPDDLPSGFGAFLAGYAYWQSGDLTSAGALMQQGVAIVGKQLGWDHPTCIEIMTQYARFLRNTHQRKAARTVEKELEQARSQCVDCHGPETLNVASLF